MNMLVHALLQHRLPKALIQSKQEPTVRMAGTLPEVITADDRHHAAPIHDADAVAGISDRLQVM